MTSKIAATEIARGGSEEGMDRKRWDTIEGRMGWDERVRNKRMGGREDGTRSEPF